MPVINEEDWASLKEKGNEHFKTGFYNEAVASYTQALEKTTNKDSRALLYKNRAAAYLKLEKHENALNDTNNSLELCANDVKALFRRCQALEALGKVNEAFVDAKMVLHLDPKNSAVVPVLQGLSAKLQDIAKEQASTANKFKQMLDILKDKNSEAEKRVQAANNLFVLAKERAGVELVGQSLQHIGQALRLTLPSKVPKCEIRLALLRVLGEVCRENIPRTQRVLGIVGIAILIECLSSEWDTQITATQYVIQNMLDSLSGLNLKEPGKKPNKQLMADHQGSIDGIMHALTKKVNARTMSAKGRDAILELLMKNVDYEALDWGKKLVETGGLENLLEVASELPEVKYESSIEISNNTRPNLAVTIEKVYMCHDSDPSREKFSEKMNEFVNHCLRGPDIEAKIRITAAITILLQGALDAGNKCLSQQGVVEMMLTMAGCDDLVQQRVAAEAVIAAASKKDKCSSIANLGAGIIKKLYQSKDDGIKVRALVGLCKLGSLGGTDASIRPFSDGSNLKLSSSCRKFLINPRKDNELRKWAAEGLAYLTLDADVKEDLVGDTDAMKALIELAKVGGKGVLYGVVTTLVNLTNSYDKQEIIPELVELAKFSKQHVPEDHPMDAPDFVVQRVKALSDAGVTTALVALSDTESQNSRELISRVFNSICETQELRGAVVQQGGAKVLIRLSQEKNTEKGKTIAAQALSRLAITIDPQVAFPGQRSAEVVRPLMQLLHPDCSGLQNFEALLALTNLAQIGENIRQRILADCGLTKIENCMYEDHLLIMRAATQCMVNLMFSPKVIEAHEGENDRVKYLLILSEDEDVDTAKSAAAALAVATGSSTKICQKIFTLPSWEERLCQLGANSDPEILHRGVTIFYNLVQEEECAQKFTESKILDVLMAIVQPEVMKAPQVVRDIAQKALDKLQKFGLIQPNLNEP